MPASAAASVQVAEVAPAIGVRIEVPSASTLGNIVSGCVFVSFCYWLASRRVARCPAPVAAVPVSDRNRI
ncbi:MAG: hypothetical protein OXC10_13440, partial [Rhodospirillaceae bacterium]|nr:hypothetical protein [Rhodospirillaceae bacterium]